jgi:hypothetical protein
LTIFHLLQKKNERKKIDFKWFIIGFGGDEDLIKRNIKIAKVENEVIVLGKKKILILTLYVIIIFILLVLKESSYSKGGTDFKKCLYLLLIILLQKVRLIME